MFYLIYICATSLRLPNFPCFILFLFVSVAQKYDSQENPVEKDKNTVVLRRKGSDTFFQSDSKQFKDFKTAKLVLKVTIFFMGYGKNKQL